MRQGPIRPPNRRGIRTDKDAYMRLGLLTNERHSIQHAGGMSGGISSNFKGFKSTIFRLQK